MADRNPERVKSILLSAAFADLDRVCEMNWRMRKAIVEQIGINEILKYHVVMWTLNRDFVETDAGWAAAQKIVHIGTLNQVDPQLYIHFLDAILDFGKVQPGQENEVKYTEKIKKMNIPTIAIVGDRDILTPPAMSEKICKLMPNAKLAVLKNCGHITFVEKPEETCRAIEDLIKSIPK